MIVGVVQGNVGEKIDKDKRVQSHTHKLQAPVEQT
jgi:hypothetical protein